MPLRGTSRLTLATSGPAVVSPRRRAARPAGDVERGEPRAVDPGGDLDHRGQAPPAAWAASAAG